MLKNQRIIPHLLGNILSVDSKWPRTLASPPQTHPNPDLPWRAESAKITKNSDDNLAYLGVPHFKNPH
jgi:hypothetical protein